MKGIRYSALACVLVAVVAIDVVSVRCSNAASSATKVWEVYHSKQVSPWFREIGIDPRNGDIYAQHVDTGNILKYDWNGNLVGTFPKAVPGKALPNSVQGLAIDPLTGYVYVSTSASDMLIDVYDFATPPGQYVRSVAVSIGRTVDIEFSKDGQKLYASLGGTSAPIELARTDPNATSSDPTDDVFVPTGLSFTSTGILPTTNRFDQQGIAVDNADRLYTTDRGASSIHPVRRYNPDGTLDLEFYTADMRADERCAIDDNNYFWTRAGWSSGGASKAMVCYKEGIEVYRILNTDAGANFYTFGLVGWDNVHKRLIVTGQPSAGSTVYISSWSYDIDPSEPLNMGTISGRFVDADTGADVSTVNALALSGTNWGYARFGALGSSTFSVPVKAGNYDVVGSAPDYLTGLVTNYDVIAGGTTTVADIPLTHNTVDSPAQSVSIQLGTHNICQGITLTKGQTWACKTIASVQGGKDCRGFGAAGDRAQSSMLFDVDSAFADPSGNQPIWVEVDSYNNEVSRWRLWLDCKTSWTMGGWHLKDASNTWQTIRFFRPDGKLVNGTSGSDVCLGANTDTDIAKGYPGASSYVSKITLRRAPTASSFVPVSTIADVKKNYLYLSDGANDYTFGNAGGPAVQLSGAIVTASFPTYFYIEDKDRSSGIRVEDASMPAPGTIVSISGCVAVTTTGEMSIKPYLVENQGSVENPIKPVLVNGKATGGGPLTTTWAGFLLPTQYGVKGATGVSNVGLLARIVGKAKNVTTDPDTGEVVFYVDDGSAVISDSTNLGVKILAPSATVIPNEGDMVTATGIISLGLNIDDVPAHWLPVLLVSNPIDIDTVP